MKAGASPQRSWKSTRRPWASASKAASSTMLCSRAGRSISSSRGPEVPESRRARVSSSSTISSRRWVSRSMRSRAPAMRLGSWCTRPTAACRRARGERSSWETSWKRRRWVAIRASSCWAMASNSWPSSPISSLRLANSCPRRVSRRPAATARKPWRRRRMGPTMVHARRALKARLATRPVAMSSQGRGGLGPMFRWGGGGPPGSPSRCASGGPPPGPKRSSGRKGPPGMKRRMGELMERCARRQGPGCPSRMPWRALSSAPSGTGRPRRSVPWASTA